MTTTTTTTTPPAPATEQPEQESEGFWNLTRVIIASVAAFLGIYVIIFIAGLIFALLSAESAALWFGYFNNLLRVALSLVSAVAVVGLGILIVQVARFVNLLRSEVKPITEDTRQALSNVRTTSEFVQKHGVVPIIKAQSFFAGLVAFLREIVRLSRVLQRRRD